MRIRLLALAALSLALTLPATASAADQSGSKGKVTKVQVNSPSSDTFLQYHGRVFVETGKKDKKKVVEYRWGGTSCGSKVLNADMVQILFDAARRHSKLTPLYKGGQGQTKCLVGFMVQ